MAEAHAMSQTKRAFLTLHIDSNAEHVYQRVTKHSSDEGTDAGKDHVELLQSKGPVVGHTDVRVVTKPFEKVVNSVVRDVAEGSGKRVVSLEEREGQGERVDRTQSPTQRTVSLKRRADITLLQQKYDTSEL